MIYFYRIQYGVNPYEEDYPKQSQGAISASAWYVNVDNWKLRVNEGEWSCFKTELWEFDFDTGVANKIEDAQYVLIKPKPRILNGD
jgi:hypothetical protein